MVHVFCGSCMSLFCQCHALLQCIWKWWPAAPMTICFMVTEHQLHMPTLHIAYNEIRNHMWLVFGGQKSDEEMEIHRNRWGWFAVHIAMRLFNRFHDTSNIGDIFTTISNQIDDYFILQLCFDSLSLISNSVDILCGEQRSDWNQRSETRNFDETLNTRLDKHFDTPYFFVVVCSPSLKSISKRENMFSITVKLHHNPIKSIYLFFCAFQFFKWILILNEFVGLKLNCLWFEWLVLRQFDSVVALKAQHCIKFVGEGMGCKRERESANEHEKNMSNDTSDNWRLYIFEMLYNVFFFFWFWSDVRATRTTNIFLD